MAFFPLNATYGTKEINIQTAPGDPSGVSLAAGPNGKANGSYEFSGISDSYIEFPNSPGGALDVRYSMTMLCWFYHCNQNGPLFEYGSNGVRLSVLNGELLVNFKKRYHSDTAELKHAILAGGWKFVGASYDRTSGEAKLWVDGAVVQAVNVGAGHKLATNNDISMGRNVKGRITEMQVYNVALNQEQVRKLQQRTQRAGM